MSTLIPDEDIPPGSDELFTLLDISAKHLYRSEDLNEFLDWIEAAGPLLAPGMAQAVDPRTGPVGLFFRALGVNIYGATPLPGHDFRAPPLPKPSRNAPCLCGSGRKYKHCCLNVEKIELLQHYNMLRHLLDQFPQKALAALVESRVDTEAVADTANQWLNEGDERRALALLEPWFKPGVALKRRHVPLFEVLADLYLDLDNPVKRKKLVARVAQAEDETLRATGLQRQATMLMDEGKATKAWESFRAAQRLDPDSPALAVMEITLLCAQGEYQQVSARAEFWQARFTRNGKATPELLELLADCAEDPAILLEQGEPLPDEAILVLVSLLQRAPVPAARYRVELHDSEGMLVSDNALRRLETQWCDYFQPVKPFLIQTQHGDTGVWLGADQWLPLLQREPSLWQSFEVLDDLTMAVDALASPELDSLLLEPLLDRAVELLNCNLAGLAGTTTSFTLPWMMLENRPALRTLAHKVFRLSLDFDETGPEFIRLAEHLIALNPADNHGVRESLSTAYIANGEPRECIDLADHYPEEILCTLKLNRVLALYCDNQEELALTALADIAECSATAIAMLLAKSPKEPEFSGQGVVVGGEEEAWLYREATLDLWQQHGALEWLRQAITSMNGGA